MMKSLLIFIIFFSATIDCSAQSGGILVNSLAGKLTVDSAVVGSKICSIDTMTNTGDADLIITSWSLSGLNDSDFSVIGFNTPFTLQAHNSYLVEVCSTPKGEGLRFATFTINTTSNGVSHNFTVPLFIFGIGASSSVLQASMNNGFSLGQNFPNPSTGIVTLNYSVPIESEITIALSGITGGRIKSILNSRVSEGPHTITFDISSLTSGSYIISLESGNLKLTKELNLTK